MPIPPYHIHPMVVHFPVALLFTAAIFEWILPVFCRVQKERLQWAAVCLLWAGSFFAAPAIATGLWAESTAPVIPSAYDVVDWHKWAGIVTGVISLILSVWRIFRRPPLSVRPTILYGVLWLALLIALGIAGFYGGQLVYDFGVGVVVP